MPDRPTSELENSPASAPADATARGAPARPADDDGWIKVPSICAGDIVRFRERVFRGKYPRRKRIGRRTIVARVLRESYGIKRQQHTFTIEVIWCEGKDALAPGAVIRRKGRNLYRQAKRRLWDDEAARLVALEEKYARREDMRVNRTARKRRAAKQKANERRNKRLKEARAREAARKSGERGMSA